MKDRIGYREVLERRPESGSEGNGYLLHLGLFALDPIPYSTLRQLTDCHPAVRQALRHGYLERPVLWGDLTGEPPRHCRENLQDLGILLATLGRELATASRPGAGFCALIVRHWRDLTREVVGRLRTLEDSAGIDRWRPVLARYRCEACACVEALEQFLPPTDPLAEEVRDKLEHGETSLVWSFGLDRDRIEFPSWSVISTRGAVEEPGFVTWGIP